MRTYEDSKRNNPRETCGDFHDNLETPHDNSKKIYPWTYENSKKLIPDDFFASLDCKIDETLDFSCEMLIQQSSQHKWQDIERNFLLNWP